MSAISYLVWISLTIPGHAEPAEQSHHLAGEGGGGGGVAVPRAPERARVQKAETLVPGVEVAVGLVRALPAPVVAPVVAQPAVDHPSLCYPSQSHLSQLQM